MSRPRIGLALGSGSARGWSHVGVVEALAEAGIEPEIVCGTSMGALIGASYVAGRLPDLRRWAEAATWRDFVGLMDIRFAGGGLVDARRVIALLRRLGVNQKIESLEKRFAAVATDLEDGREVWLDRGPILDAVRASIALPGLVSPARVGGRWLLDGGLCNPVPVSLCRALGAEVIIAVNLNGSRLGPRSALKARRRPASETDVAPTRDLLDRLLERVPATLRGEAWPFVRHLAPRGPAAPGYVDVLSSAIHIMQDQITRTRLAGEPPHVLLVPQLSHFGLMEFNRAREAIAEGCACVERALPLLRRQLGDT